MKHTERNCLLAGIALGVAGTLTVEYLLDQQGRAVVSPAVAPNSAAPKKEDATPFSCPQPSVSFASPASTFITFPPVAPAAPATPATEPAATPAEDAVAAKPVVQIEPVAAPTPPVGPSNGIGFDLRAVRTLRSTPEEIDAAPRTPAMPTEMPTEKTDATGLVAMPDEIAFAEDITPWQKGSTTAADGGKVDTADESEKTDAVETDKAEPSDTAESNEADKTEAAETDAPDKAAEPDKADAAETDKAENIDTAETDAADESEKTDKVEPSDTAESNEVDKTEAAETDAPDKAAEPDKADAVEADKADASAEADAEKPAENLGENSSPEFEKEAEKAKQPTEAEKAAQTKANQADDVAALKKVLCAIAGKYAKVYFDKDLNPDDFRVTMVQKAGEGRFVPVTDPSEATELFLFGESNVPDAPVSEFILSYNTALKTMTCFGLEPAGSNAMNYASL